MDLQQLSNGYKLFLSGTAMETEDTYREEDAEKMEQEENIVNSNIRNNIIYFFFLLQSVDTWTNVDLKCQFNRIFFVVFQELGKCSRYHRVGA